MKHLWAQRKVLVGLGAGGVGKTTVCAAMAVAAAMSGRKTLVMTIDPARRLANAMGLTESCVTPQEIPTTRFAPFGIELTAPLWVLMPEVRTTFDELVRRYAASAQQERAVLDNVAYRQFTQSLAGAHEYAAIEQLHALYSSRQYDLIVVDTPPAQNVGDFLSAPDRIVAFLEQESVQWLLGQQSASRRVSSRLLSLGSVVVSRSLRNLAGAETWSAMVEFLGTFEGMFAGFRERAQQMRALLDSDELGFVWVGSAHRSEWKASARFLDSITTSGRTVHAAVLNRAHRPPYDPAHAAVVRARLTQAVVDADAGQLILAALDDEVALAQQTPATERLLHERLGDAPVVTLPELPADVHDWVGLAQLCQCFL